MDDVQRIKIEIQETWGKDYADNGCKNKKSSEGRENEGSRIHHL